MTVGLQRGPSGSDDPAVEAYERAPAGGNEDDPAGEAGPATDDRIMPDDDEVVCEDSVEAATDDAGVGGATTDDDNSGAEDIAPFGDTTRVFQPTAASPACWWMTSPSAPPSPSRSPTSW